MSPCSTCAFRDPEAWLADPAIALKINQAINDGEGFFCHDGLACHDHSYEQPRLPDGTVDYSKLKICAAFLRVYPKLRGRRQTEVYRIVRRLQLVMLRRYLASSRTHAKRLRRAGSPEQLAEACDLLAIQRGWDSELAQSPLARKALAEALGVLRE